MCFRLRAFAGEEPSVLLLQERRTAMHRVPASMTTRELEREIEYIVGQQADQAEMTGTVSLSKLMWMQAMLQELMIRVKRGEKIVIMEDPMTLAELIEMSSFTPGRIMEVAGYAVLRLARKAPLN